MMLKNEEEIMKGESYSEVWNTTLTDTSLDYYGKDYGKDLTFPLEPSNDKDKAKYTNIVEGHATLPYSNSVAFNSTYNYSVVGIDVHKIEAMRDAITTFMKTTTEKMDAIAEEVEPEKFIKGENIVNAVKQYLKKAFSGYYSTVSDLIFFAHKLVIIKNYYERLDVSTSEDLGMKFETDK